MKRLFTLLSLFFILACNQNNTPEPEEEETTGLPKRTVTHFNIELPAGWKHVKQQGIDSSVGFFTDETDSLYYDFGWYTHGFERHYGDNTDYIIEKIVIHEKPGQWLYPHKSGEGIVGVFLQADSLNTLTISGRSKNANNYYWNIFRTITFVEKEN